MIIIIVIGSLIVSGIVFGILTNRALKKEDKYQNAMQNSISYIDYLKVTNAWQENEEIKRKI